MNSLKTIVTGIIFIIIAILLMQLAYLMIIVGLNSLAKDYPALNNISGTVGYLFTITTIIAIMFAGGYLTALIAEKRILLHCLIVGFITIGGMIWMSLENAQLTSIGILINTLLLIATLLGGFYQIKRETRQELKQQ